MRNGKTRGPIIILAALLVVVFSASLFSVDDRGLAVFPSAYLSEKKLLSDYNAHLKGTAGDTEVFIFEGEKPGGTLFVLGGAHPDEASGVVAALLLAENARLSQGRMIVIPFGNRSGFSHNLPQEGHPPSYTLETPGGPRLIKYGSRLTNSIHQWPDPTIYLQQVDGQKLAGVEARNLNRAYPGREDGTLTARIAQAIMTLIREEQVDLAVDLHESSPEYPVNNAIVSHDRGMELAIISSLELSFAGVEIGIEPSPINLRGLSHREWGDASDVYAFLLESANPAQGRLRGRTDAELVISGKDRMYVKAYERGRLFVTYPTEGIPISVRAGRHLASILALAATFSEMHPDRPIVVDNIPDYSEIVAQGVGKFLKATPR